MAKVYMNDFRVTTSVVPILRYLDGNKTDELVIFTDDKTTDFDTHIALIDNNVVKLFANESGFAAIIDKDIFNEKDVCPIRLVFSNSEAEKTKGTNTFYICNDRTGYVYGDYIEVPDDIITYREACRAYAEECGRIVDAVKFDVGAKVTQDEDGATITVTDTHGTTQAKILNGKRGPVGERGPIGETGPEPEITARVVGDNTEILSNGVVIATLASGKNGVDGHTPEITATKENATVTIYVDGVKVIDIHDGVDGATGPQGEKGDPGPQGLKGDAGETGPRGETGPQGIQGIKGDTGLQGPAGETGPQGPIGKTGPQGPAGNDGHSPIVTATKTGTVTTLSIDGKIAATINDGATGPQGPQGLKGETGATGETGPRGPQGLKGDPGEMGPQGPIGETGATGPTGQAGHSPIVKASKTGTVTTISIDGVNVVSINDGEQGPQGIQGVKGDPGIQGPVGEPGAAGHSPNVTATKAGTVTTVKVDGVAIATINDGAKGETGARGPQGIQGPIGETGPQGLKGETGAAGKDGHSPSVTATKSGTVTTVKVDGATIATINDGEKGETGARGPQGLRGETGATGPAYTLTESDKNTIANAVLALMVNAESTGM